MSDETKKVLIVDDEEGMRHMLTLVLEKAGYRVVQASGGMQALAALQDESVDLVLCDLRMPEMDGMQFLREVARRSLAVTVIMMSAYGTLDAAIECMKHGAYDYISKPFKPDEVILTLRKAEERLGLRRENARLKERLAQREVPQAVFASESMANVMAMVRQVADSSSPVLVTGETGTGKELIARALHNYGTRKAGPFIAVNCSAIPAALIESELFGHVRGAFTGAERERIGLFVAAHGGTLFLDEVGELPLELQPKLLRALQEGEIRRVGDTRAQQVDVRIVAATARDLRTAVAKGTFRDDLFYRLAVIEIALPPLRERPGDIPLLARHFLARIAERQKVRMPELTSAALLCLQQYAWPGNVRELENCIERAAIFCRNGLIDATDLPLDACRHEEGGGQELSLKDAMARLERDYICRALAATGGNRTQAARMLEISLRGLLYKMKEYGLG